jgi:hypothetical protein
VYKWALPCVPWLKLFRGTSSAKAYVKKNPIPLTDPGVLWGCEKYRLPHFIDNRFTVGGRVAALRAGSALPHRKIPGTEIHLMEFLIKVICNIFIYFIFISF